MGGDDSFEIEEGYLINDSLDKSKIDIICDIPMLEYMENIFVTDSGLYDTRAVKSPGERQMGGCGS